MKGETRLKLGLVFVLKVEFFFFFFKCGSSLCVSGTMVRWKINWLAWV